MASSLMKYSGGLHVKPSLRSSHALPSNPISNMKISRTCEDTYLSSWTRNKAAGVLRCNDMAKRDVFVVYANNVPEVPLPSGPPPSSPKSWILGLIVSLIIPFFTNKLGPLGLLINRFETAVQKVEDIVEAVEDAAKEVDKIAENLAHDLPEGKLKDLVEAVEDVAEKVAKDADCLDNIIDQVQEAQDEVEDMVAKTVAEKTKKSPKK